MSELLAKAERAYEAARKVRTTFAGTFAGMVMPPWDRLVEIPGLREAWVEKVASVEADPKRWLESDDPVCVAIAIAVMGPIVRGGSC